MNKDIFLQFFYNLIENKYLEEKINISYIFKDNFLTRKNMIKKIKNIQKFIIEIKLENNKTLLFEDLPLNFLISYGILIGDKSEIIEFETTQKNTYICEKRLFKNIKDKFEIKNNNIKNISPKDIFNKKFELKYEKPKIINKIIKNIKNNTNLNMNKIHIIKSNNIENFIPNTKKSHLKLAKAMKLPLTELLENNYIKESTINIYDENTIKNIIKPLFTYKKQEEILANKENELILFKDIEKNYYLNLEKFIDKIIKIIQNTKIVNFDKEEIISKIKNLKQIKLSSYQGKYSLPIWESENKANKYLKIQNKKDFELISGVKFNLDFKLFNNIYLQTTNGEKVIYKKKYLNKNLEKYFEDLESKFNSKKLIFKDLTDLIIITILYHKNIDENTQIIAKYNLNNNHANELKIGINQILNKILEATTLENRKINIKQKRNTYLQEYYYQIGNLIKKIFSNYITSPNKKILINESLKTIISIKKTIKYEYIKFEEVYFLIRNIKLLNKILAEFNINASKEINEKILVFFNPKKKINEKNEKINFELIKIFTDLNLINNITKNRKNKNKKIFLILKNKKINKFNLNSNKNIEIITLDSTYKEYVKPNIRKIKEVFKYSSKEIIKEIQKLSKKNLKSDGSIEINIKNKKATIKTQFYTIFKKYDKYKTICENKYFVALSRK